jgi:hypothetical protein
MTYPNAPEMPTPDAQRELIEATVLATLAPHEFLTPLAIGQLCSALCNTLAHPAPVAAVRDGVREAIDEMADAGLGGVDYVGAANYRERQEEARADIEATRDRLIAKLAPYLTPPPALNEEAVRACAMRDVLDQAMKAFWEAKHDYAKHGTSEANYSDGEYTQDYATRAKRVDAAYSTVLAAWSHLAAERKEGQP